MKRLFIVLLFASSVYAYEPYRIVSMSSMGESMSRDVSWYVLSPNERGFSPGRQRERYASMYTEEWIWREVWSPRAEFSLQLAGMQVNKW
jgi:hypothetical protein